MNWLYNYKVVFSSVLLFQLKLYLFNILSSRKDIGYKQCEIHHISISTYLCHIQQQIGLQSGIMLTTNEHRQSHGDQLCF